MKERRKKAYKAKNHMEPVCQREHAGNRRDVWSGGIPRSLSGASELVLDFSHRRVSCPGGACCCCCCCLKHSRVECTFKKQNLRINMP